MFKWKTGRQGTGYEVLTLLCSEWLKADCYIIRYREGSSIPQHTDKVETGYKHFRLNLVLRAASAGGVLQCERSIFRLGPLNLFRPDEVAHSVTKVTKGSRYVLSIGWKCRSK
jgi:hypothetical protein